MHGEWTSDTHTNRHCNSLTDLAQRAKSVKILNVGDTESFNNYLSPVTRHLTNILCSFAACIEI